MIPFPSHFIEKDPPGEEEGQRVAYFVPDTVGGPFEKLVLMDTTKDLAVNMAGETLTIKEWQDTKSSYQSFVIKNISWAFVAPIFVKEKRKKSLVIFFA